MNALVWIVTGIAVGWFVNTLGAEEHQATRALTLLLAAAGAVLAGWLLAPTGGVLALQWDNYLVDANMAALLGALLAMVALHWVLRALGPGQKADLETAATDRLVSSTRGVARSLPVADTGPDTVPSARHCRAEGDPRGNPRWTLPPGARLRE